MLCVMRSSPRVYQCPRAALQDIRTLELNYGACVEHVFHRSGSVYLYAYVAFGEFFAVLFGLRLGWNFRLLRGMPTFILVLLLLHKMVQECVGRLPCRCCNFGSILCLIPAQDAPKLNHLACWVHGRSQCRKSVNRVNERIGQIAL